MVRAKELVLMSMFKGQRVSFTSESEETRTPLRTKLDK